LDSSSDQVSVLPVRIDLSNDLSARELLARVRATVLDAHLHQRFSMQELVTLLDPDAESDERALCNVVVESDERAAPSPTEKRATPTSPAMRTYYGVDLVLTARREPGGLRIMLNHRASRFDGTRAQAMLDQLSHVLAQMAEQPDIPTSKLSLVTPLARRVLPDPAEPLTRHSQPWEGLIQTRFSVQAKQVPDRLAVQDPYQRWTYGELDIASNMVAHALVAQGIEPGDVVAIYASRSATLVWAILGVLKAGAAFALLEPEFPPAYLVERLQIASPRAWLQSQSAGHLDPAVQECLQELGCTAHLALPDGGPAAAFDHFAEFPQYEPRVTVGPDALVAVGFTSGSTGTPNAVPLVQRSVAHFTERDKRPFVPGETHRCSLLASPSGSNFRRALLWPLLLGGSVCIPSPEELGRPGGLAAWMAREEITIARFTPGQVRILTDAVREDEPSQTLALRYAYVGGDTLTWRDVAHLQQLAPAAIIVNHYGATEMPSSSAEFAIPAGAAPPVGAQLVPIGRGDTDVQLLVLNNALRLTGIGELGELYVRSPYVASGYLGSETSTAERFIANPYTTVDGDRLYKTGDIGRYLPDGNVETLGRNVHHVKIRGYRVAPADVESVLLGHPSVAQAVVVAREDQRRNMRLVAYTVSSENTPAEATELRKFLQARLPNYMVPTAWMDLRTLPLTLGGKIDREALPLPTPVSPSANPSLLESSNPIERELARLWQATLGHWPASQEDSFFAMGGDSLSAAHLLAGIERSLDKRIPLASFLQDDSFGALASLLRQSESRALWRSLVPLHPEGTRRPIFCVHGIGGEVLEFAPLAKALGPDQPTFGLQARALDPRQVAPNSIEEMAQDYLDEVRAVQQHGPYCLLGYSFGGTVVYEMAQQLLASGETVALLAILDQPANRATYLKRRSVGRYFARLWDGFWIGIPRWRTVLDRQQFKHIPNYAKHGVQQGWKLFRRDWIGGREHQNPAWLDNRPEKWRDIVPAHSTISRAYVPRSYAGHVTLFRAREQPHFFRDPEMGWGRLASGLSINIVPGEHSTIMRDPNVTTLAKELRAYL
jgi:amino acid adenylation domain-containing protein